MIELLITRARSNDEDWSVWATLPDHDALEDSFGFVIGTGVTREAAIADAVSELNEAATRLQSSPASIPVRIIR